MEKLKISIIFFLPTLISLPHPSYPSSFLCIVLLTDWVMRGSDSRIMLVDNWKEEVILKAACFAKGYIYSLAYF